MLHVAQVNTARREKSKHTASQIVGEHSGLDHRIGHPVGAVPFAKRAKMAQAQEIYEIKSLCKFSPSGRHGDQGQHSDVQ
jgi:hypothetical protein